MRDLQRGAAAALAFLAILLGSSLLRAADPPQEPEPARESDQTRRESAKEARIQEYLRKREERRTRREDQARAGEAERQARAEEQAQTEEAEQPPEATEPATAQAQPTVVEPAPVEERKTPRRARQGRAAAPFPSLPRGLAKAQQSVRATSLGQDPTVRTYLEMIERQAASPQQLAAFGNFLAQNGMTADALEYYGVALRLEPNDSLLWMNAGTLHRQRGDLSAASSAYNRSLALNANNALAHYNLGAVLDGQGKYEAALAEYKLALTLDPNLGDPAYNPQAANNERLLAVKLMVYGEQSGSLGLPLATVPGGGVEEDAPANRSGN